MNKLLRRAVYFAAVLAAVLVVLIANLAWLPSAYLTQGLTQLSQGRMLVLSSQGTVWNGAVQLALRSGGQTQAARVFALPGALRWRTSWHFSRRPLHLHWSGDALIQQAFTTELGWGGIQISPGALGLPAMLLEAAGAPFNTLKPAGIIELSWPSLLLERSKLEVSATLEWRNVQVAVSRVAPVGSYRAQIQAQQQQGSFVVSTLAGPLQVQGSGQWRPGQANFFGSARSEPAQQQALASLLTLLGPSQPDGSVQLRFGSKSE